MLQTAREGEDAAILGETEMFDMNAAADGAHRTIDTGDFLVVEFDRIGCQGAVKGRSG